MVLTESNRQLELGSKASVFKLLGVDGKEHSLDEFSVNPVLIIFMCNHCPYVIPKLDYIKKLQEDYKDKIVIIGINSNDPSDYPEDGFDNMKKISEEKGFNFLYLFDETQEVAKAYGASCTPDPFLFNEKHELIYHGRINDQMEPYDSVSEHDMRKAFDCVLAGKEIDFEVSPSIGCSIKWKR